MVERAVPAPTPVWRPVGTRPAKAKGWSRHWSACGKQALKDQGVHHLGTSRLHKGDGLLPPPHKAPGLKGLVGLAPQHIAPELYKSSGRHQEVASWCGPRNVTDELW